MTTTTHTYERIEGSWMRDGEVWVVGRSDTSPVHNGLSSSMGGDYDSDCSYCYLGASHSVASHVCKTVTSLTRLVYLPVNQAYAFTFGDQLLRLDAEPVFFGYRDDAIAAARRLGLRVSRTGAVHLL